MIKRLIQNYTIKRLVNSRNKKDFSPSNTIKKLLILCDKGQMEDSKVGHLLKTAATEYKWQVTALVYMATPFKKDEKPARHLLYKNHLNSFGLPQKTWLAANSFHDCDLIIDVSKNNSKALKYIGLYANPKLLVKLGINDPDYDWNFPLPPNNNPAPVIHSFFHFIATLK